MFAEFAILIPTKVWVRLRRLANLAAREGTGSQLWNGLLSVLPSLSGLSPPLPECKPAQQSSRLARSGPHLWSSIFDFSYNVPLPAAAASSNQRGKLCA